MLQKYKYRWSKSALVKAYTSVIRPTLEYGDILYDSCTAEDSSRIENVQLEAARIATGAKRGTSHTALYNETGWAPLAQRRQLHKLKKMHQVITLGTPSHLHSIVQSWQQHAARTTRFNTSSGIIIPRCSSSRFKNSPLISAITTWNRLDNNIRCEASPTKFRTHLSKLFPKPNPLPVHPNSLRSVQIAHMQMRMHFSNLNSHLASKGCVPNPICPCNNPSETTDHYLFHCPLYNQPRSHMLTQISLINPTISLSTHYLLHGHPSNSNDQNIQLFKYLYDFIHVTKRLL
jgi:hypothetical protein